MMLNVNIMRTVLFNKRNEKYRVWNIQVHKQHQQVRCFDLKGKERLGQPKVFKPLPCKYCLLSTPSNQTLVNNLGIDRQIISDCRPAIKKYQKIEEWLLYQLDERGVSCCFLLKKKSLFQRIEEQRLDIDPRPKMCEIVDFTQPTFYVGTSLLERLGTRSF